MIKKLGLITSITLAVGALSATTAFAAMPTPAAPVTSPAAKSLKVGVVDVGLVFQRSDLFKSMSAKVKKQMQDEEASFEAATKNLRAEMQQLVAQVQKMKPEEVQQASAKYKADQAQLEAMGMKLQQQISQQRSAMMDQFAQILNQTSYKVGAQKGMDLVLVKQVVLYPNEVDLTDEVLAALPKS